MRNVQLLVSMHFCAQSLGELIDAMFWPILVTPLLSLTNCVLYLFRIHSATAVVVAEELAAMVVAGAVVAAAVVALLVVVTAAVVVAEEQPVAS